MELIALKRGWSLKLLAEKSGITQEHLKNLKENKLKYIDPDTLQALKLSLQVTPNDLLLPMEDVIYD